MPHQLFAAGLQARDIYPELKKYFYKENSDVTWEDFLTTKFGLQIDTRSIIGNTLHGSGRTVEKSGILLQIEKVPEVRGDLAYYVFSLEDAVAHISKALMIVKLLSLSVSYNFMTLKKDYKTSVVAHAEPQGDVFTR